MKPDCDTTNHEPAALRGGRLGRAGKRRMGIRGESGQAVTEFGLILPFFAVIILVAVLFGKGLYAYIQLTHTANEAARLISVDQPTSGSICTALKNVAALPGGVSLQIIYPNPSGPSVPAQQAGEAVTVQASAGTSWIPFVTGNLTSSATMRLEQTTGANLTGTCS